MSFQLRELIALSSTDNRFEISVSITLFLQNLPLLFLVQNYWESGDFPHRNLMIFMTPRQRKLPEWASERVI